MNGQKSARRNRLVESRRFVVLICVVTIVSAWVFVQFMLVFSQEKASRLQLERIGSAIQGYQYAHGHFPPPIVVDVGGRPMHSWRVLILPYLEKNWFRGFYDLNEPWNGPHNRRLNDAYTIEEDGRRRDVTEVRHAFRSPNARESQDDRFTNYVMVVNTDVTPLPCGERLGSTFLQDHFRYYPPAGGTIMVVEIAETDIHWLEPRDLTLGDLIGASNKSELSVSGFSFSSVGRSFVIMSDGTGEYLDEATTRARLMNISRINQ